MIKVLKLALFLVLTSSSLSAQQSGIQWIDNDIDLAMRQAASSDKMVFIYAYTTWCGPCKAMKKSVFPTTEVGEFYNEAFINVKMDMEKGKGFELGEKYQVQAYPTFLFVDKVGKVVHKSMGGRQLLEFIELGNAALDPDRQIATLHDRYAKGERSSDFLKQYAQVISESEFTGFEPISEQYLATQDDWTTAENMKFIFDYSEADIESKLFQHTLENRAAFEQLIGKEKVKAKFEFAAERDRSKAGIPRDDVERLKKHYDKYFSKEDSYNLAMQTYFRQLMYSPEPVEQEKFKAEIQLYLAGSPDLDWNFYNASAWQIFELSDDESLLREAANWTLVSISKEENSHNTDTMAHILEKLDDVLSAKMYAEKSIELAKLNGEDYTETEKLLKKL